MGARTAMVSTELSAAVLVADVALYGFMIVYYAFSLTLREQERSRVFLQRSLPAKQGMTDEERDRAVRRTDEESVDASARAGSASMFLLGCTLFAVPSGVLGILALVGVDVLGLWAVALFLLFLVVVAAGMVGVGVQNLRQTVRDAREKLGADTPAMDILMRGIGKR